MADINGINGTGNPFLDLSKKTEESKDKSQSQSDMFMQLMIASLKNQDPVSPAETSEFMDQISNMTMVENITKMTSTMEDFANSMLSSQAALQASSLVGQTVYVPAEQTEVEAGGKLDGLVELPVSAPDVQVRVYDGSGREVATLSLGPQAAGDVPFEWPLPANLPGGVYRVEATAVGSSGDYEGVTTYLGQNVESVTLGQNGVGMRINTASGSVSLSDVKQIG